MIERNNIIINSKPNPKWKHLGFWRALLSTLYGGDTIRISCSGHPTDKIYIKKTSTRIKVEIKFTANNVVCSVEEKSAIKAENIQALYKIRETKTFCFSELYTCVLYIKNTLNYNSEYIRSTDSGEPFRYKYTENYLNFQRALDKELLFLGKIKEVIVNGENFTFITISSNGIENTITTDNIWFQTREWLGKYLVMNKLGETSILHGETIKYYFESI